MDERIVARLAESEADPDDVNIDSHLQILREAHKHETQAKEYLEQVTATQEYVTYLVATSRLDMDAAQAHPVILATPGGNSAIATKGSTRGEEYRKALQCRH
ncbi:hypothetical protein OS493_038392 [Desmophyllum pertusum]|uniref:Uncharacterized protein n=1 Tax=Desmophyllum pertusum TaxID=174260 RepID=A0A9W9Z6E7_9CNID|nr:hypothetical protein OS493_038392 [Desmophyllum pertusum]